MMSNTWFVSNTYDDCSIRIYQSSYNAATYYALGSAYTHRLCHSQNAHNDSWVLYKLFQ